MKGQTAVTRKKPCPALAAVTVARGPRGLGERAFHRGDVWQQAPAVVVFESDTDKLSMRIYPGWGGPKSASPIAACETPCTLRLMPARYRLLIDETDETLAGGRTITIEGSSRLTVSPRGPTQRAIGVLLGVTGPVVSSVGILLAGVTRECGSGCYAGLALFLSGSAMTAGGWVLYALGARPGLDVQPITGSQQRAKRTLPRFGVVATPHGASLGASFEF